MLTTLNYPSPRQWSRYIRYNSARPNILPEEERKPETIRVSKTVTQMEQKHHRELSQTRVEKTTDVMRLINDTVKGHRKSRVTVTEKLRNG